MTLTKEAVQNPEALKSEIEEVYKRVFSSEQEFSTYFFSTADNTSHDLQVRLGVFIKRLMEVPSERFWLMKYTNAVTEFPATSIHKLSSTGGYNQALALNGYTQLHIDSWQEEQPSDLQNFLQAVEMLLRAKLELPPSESYGAPKTIYQFPHMSLSTDEINEVVNALIPNSETKLSEYSSGDRHFNIENPSVDFSIHVWKHQIFGDYIGITFSKEAVHVTDDIRKEYANYYEGDVVPAILKNAISALDPKLIQSSIQKEKKPGSVFERIFLTPNILYHEGKPTEKSQYYAWGNCVDLNFEYARELGLIPKEMRYFDHTFPGGWFYTTEQLWHALFNSPFPGEVSTSEADTTNTSIQLRATEISTTHRRVIEQVCTDEYSLKDFTQRAQEVVSSYRFFTQNDAMAFSFPEGYQPIAVALSNDFAIGFKEMEGGIELCFQVPNENVIQQIESQQTSNLESITRLRQRNKVLERMKKSYRKNQD